MKFSKSYAAIPPGETIKNQLELKNLSQKEFSLKMNFSEKYTSNLLEGKEILTSDIALKLEAVLDIPASFWINLESIYQRDLQRVETELSQVLK